MRSFDVLDRRLDLKQHLLLEASAGTGKTFAIENIVIRLLVEEAISLEQILAVTFTKAATSDLKRRVRESLRKALLWLSGEGSPPDFITAWLEKGAEEILRAKKIILQALAGFDGAQIFTIHGFCARTLQERPFEADMALDTMQEEGALQDEQIGVIRDIFRSEIDNRHFSVGELRLLIAEHDQCVEKLERRLLHLLNENAEIATTSLLEDRLRQLAVAKSRLSFTSSEIMAEFDRLAPSYKGLCNRQKQLKPEIVKKAQAFADLFDRPAWQLPEYEALLVDQLSYCQLFAEKNLGARVEKPHSPLLEALQRELTMLISPTQLLMRLAKRAQTLWMQRRNAVEALTFDGLLKAMSYAVKDPLFCQQLKQRYRVAIIDEFQDTDPVQWQIFQALLPEIRLCLVGDPKQSIYAFRQADIYTYLDAAETLGENAHFTLDINFRSSPPLVEGLNRLFGACKELFSLPEKGAALSFKPVAPKTALGTVFEAALHFILVEAEGKRFSLEKLEKEYFLPFIAAEIIRLKNQPDGSFQQSAVLVADRFQARRVADFLKKHQISASIQRGEELTAGRAFKAFKELIEAVLHPADQNLLRRALSGPLFGWSNQQIKQIDQQQQEEELQRFFQWRDLLIQEGFPAFFDQILRHFEQLLLPQANGEELYCDLQQIGELLLEEEQKNRLFIEQLIPFLEKLALKISGGDPRLQRRSDPSLDAVSITTLHSSKGLEYGHVFTLGLIKRAKPPDLIVPVKNGLVKELQAVDDRQSKLYLRYCQEIDAEKMRQLYVAMTRAKSRLYCPVVITEEAVIDLDSSSPMELLLNKLEEPFCDWLEKQRGLISYQWLEKEQAVPNVEPAAPPQLIPPPKVAIQGRQITVSSFTSLIKARPGQEGKRAPADFSAEIKNSYTLPAGSGTGILLHELLAALPFSPLDLQDSITPYLAGTAFSAWEQTIAEMLSQAFLVDLDGFSLSEIDLAQTYREMEFLYSESKEACIKGVVDLFFYHQERYYLLDWKSNWLGPEAGDYGMAHLKEEMEREGYFLQAKLYTEALKRYLQIIDPRPFEEIFGGVFYLFLRSATFFHFGVRDALD